MSHVRPVHVERDEFKEILIERGLRAVRGHRPRRRDGDDAAGARMDLNVEDV